MRREPSIDEDGWMLRSGEEAHSSAPETFWIPDKTDRENLKIGDYAKLIFEIAVDNDDNPISVERMWVIVTEVSEFGFFGRLDNEPDAIAENHDFWLGTEVPFESHHVIDIDSGDAKSTTIAQSEFLKRWPRG